MSTPTGPLLPDTLVHGRYRVVREIGRGGMGAVFEAVDTRLGSTVALKQTLVRGEQLDDAFAREARLLSSLRHPALPVVSDYFAEGEGHFLVMQFIPGTDLATLMGRRSAPFSIGEVLPWADLLLDALDYLHTQSPPIVHRDIKPQNLKLTPRGEVVLLDFGLAKGGSTALDATQAPGASLFGYTPQFAPLEQIKGTGTGPASDLYSLAATLHAMLGDGPPPNALERASAVIQGQPDPLRPLAALNPQVPAAVSDLIGRAMALNPSERPSSAAAMRAELAAAVRTGSAGASTAGMVTVAQSPQAAAPARIAPPPPGPPAAPAPAQMGARSPLLVFAVIGGLGLLMLLALGAALAALANSWAQISPDNPPAVLVATADAPAQPPTPDPREEEPAPTAAGAIPPVVIPTIEIPNVQATVESVQATVQASLPSGVELPGQGPPRPGVGELALEFGAEGTGDGFLSDPRGVAVGPDGAIYVSDYSTRRVQRFSPEGQFERSWLVEDDGPIMALAADRQGRVYVSQVAGVSVYDGASGELRDVIAEGDGFGELIVMGDGTLLGIPWADDALVRLSPEGEELGRIEDPLGAADVDDSPAAVAADGLGTLFVMGSSGGEVFVFSPEGDFRDKFPAPGADFFPQIVVDGQGRVYVSTFMGGIAVYAADGTPAGSIPAPGYAFGLTVDTAGNLYAATNQPRVIKVRVGPR